MLQRMRTLAVQASSETNTTADQAALNIEFGALRTEIDRVADDTQWNGENILDGTGGDGSGVYLFQIGASASQTLSVTMANFDECRYRSKRHFGFNPCSNSQRIGGYYSSRHSSHQR